MQTEADLVHANNNLNTPRTTYLEPPQLHHYCPLPALPCKRTSKNPQKSKTDTSPANPAMTSFLSPTRRVLRTLGFTICDPIVTCSQPNIRSRLMKQGWQMGSRFTAPWWPYHKVEFRTGLMRQGWYEALQIEGPCELWLVTCTVARGLKLGCTKAPWKREYVACMNWNTKKWRAKSFIWTSWPGANEGAQHEKLACCLSLFMEMHKEQMNQMSDICHLLQKV